MQTHATNTKNVGVHVPGAPGRVCTYMCLCSHVCVVMCIFGCVSLFPGTCRCLYLRCVCDVAYRDNRSYNSSNIVSSPSTIHLNRFRSARLSSSRKTARLPALHFRLLCTFAALAMSSYRNNVQKCSMPQHEIQIPLHQMSRTHSDLRQALETK